MIRPSLPAILAVFLFFLGFSLGAEGGAAGLRELGYAPEERPLFADYGGFGTSVHLNIPGPKASAEDRTLILALPEATGWATVSAFLALVERFGPPLPIKIAFLADEYPDHLGLQDLLDHGGDEEHTVILYLSLEEGYNSIELHQGAAGSVAPLGALEPLTRALSRLDIPCILPLPYNELYRIGLVAGGELLRRAQAGGRAALFLRGVRLEDAPGHPAYEAAAEALYRYAETLATEPFENDYRYTILHYGPYTAYLGEGTTVALFIGLFAMILAFFLAFSLTHRRYLIALWTVFFKRSWIILVYLGLLTLCLMASGPLFVFLSGRAESGYGAAALRVLLAIALYALAGPLPALLRLPRRAHFFGHAGMLLIILAAAVAAALDITFLPVFLWAAVFAFPAALATSAQGVFIFSALAPLQLLGALGSAIGSGDSRIPALLSSSRWDVMLLAAFLVLPFLFLFKRVPLLSARRGEKLKPLRVWLSRVLFFLGVLGAVVSYGQGRGAGDELPALAKGEPMEPKLMVEGRTFLDRRILNIRLSAAGRVDRFELVLETEAEGRSVLIYDAPMPFRIVEGGRRVEFHLGYGPRNPLDLELVLPSDLQGSLHAAALRQEGPTELREEVSAPIR